MPYQIRWEEFEKYHKRGVEERRKILERAIGKKLEIPELSLETANIMTENVIAIQGLPLSVALYFRMNGKDYFVPMAIEETSVVAAASFAAKLTLPEGFKAKADPPVMTGGIFIKTEKKELKAKLEDLKPQIENAVRDITSSMEKRGGGLREIRVEERKHGLTVWIDIDVRDAMGANTINTAAEAAKQVIESAGIPVVGAILTNLCLKRLAHAEARWPVFERVDPERFMAMYEWAELDPYRAVTNNKGIMNGIDAVAVATGNDWRAIEAACHAYAGLEGQYKPLAKWEYKKDYLYGKITLPIAVGIVGGATKVNPVAKFALELSGVESAQELAMLMACVGLANNFAALRAISKEGIQRGHMRLHAKNLAIMAGAKGDEIGKVAEEMIKRGKMKMEIAKEILEELRHVPREGA